MLCMAPGVTIESAEAGLDVITRRLDEQDASSLLRVDKGRRVTLLSAGTSTDAPEIEARVDRILCRANGPGDLRA